MWDLPGLGIELVSPTLAGRFFITEPPGKPPAWSFEQERHFVTLGYPGCDMFHPPTLVLTTGPDTLKD